jgi:hypothetical protein
MRILSAMAEAASHCISVRLVMVVVGGITCSSTPMQDTKERKENQEVLVRRERRCAGSRKH